MVRVDIGCTVEAEPYIVAHKVALSEYPHNVPRSHVFGGHWSTTP